MRPTIHFILTLTLVTLIVLLETGNICVKAKSKKKAATTTSTTKTTMKTKITTTNTNTNTKNAKRKAAPPPATTCKLSMSTSTSVTVKGHRLKNGEPNPVLTSNLKQCVKLCTSTKGCAGATRFRNGACELLNAGKSSVDKTALKPAPGATHVDLSACVSTKISSSVRVPVAAPDSDSGSEDDSQSEPESDLPTELDLENEPVPETESTDSETVSHIGSDVWTKYLPDPESAESTGVESQTKAIAEIEVGQEQEIEPEPEPDEPESEPEDPEPGPEDEPELEDAMSESGSNVPGSLFGKMSNRRQKVAGTCDVIIFDNTKFTSGQNVLGKDRSRSAHTLKQCVESCYAYGKVNGKKKWRKIPGSPQCHAVNFHQPQCYYLVSGLEEGTEDDSLYEELDGWTHASILCPYVHHYLATPRSS